MIEYRVSDVVSGSLRSFDANVAHPVSEIKFEMVAVEYNTEVAPNVPWVDAPLLVYCSLFPGVPVLTILTEPDNYADDVGNNHSVVSGLMASNTMKFSQFQDVNGTFTIDTRNTLGALNNEGPVDTIDYFLRMTFIGDVIKDAMQTQHKTVTYKTANLQFAITGSAPDPNNDLTFQLSCPHLVSRMCIKTSHAVEGQGADTGLDLFFLTSSLTNGQVFWSSAGSPSSQLDGADLYVFSFSPFQVTKEIVYDVPTAIDGSYTYNLVLPSVLRMPEYICNVQVLFEMYE